MTNKTKKILIVVAIIAILIIPIPWKIKDGGTIVYNSLTYKVIVWHEENLTYESGFKTGTEVHIFPKNFKSVEYYSEQSAGEIGRNFGVSRIIDNSKECKTVDKELFYTKDTFEYYFDCKKSNDIVVVFNDRTTMTLVDALYSEKIKPELLETYGIKYEAIDRKDPETNVGNDRPEELPNIPVIE